MCGGNSKSKFCRLSSITGLAVLRAVNHWCRKHLIPEFMWSVDGGEDSNPVAMGKDSAVPQFILFYTGVGNCLTTLYHLRIKHEMQKKSLEWGRDSRISTVGNAILATFRYVIIHFDWICPISNMSNTFTAQWWHNTLDKASYSMACIFWLAWSI